MPMFCSQRVTNPWNPTVATNAKASVTPPNCASTPHSEETMRRSWPPSRPVETAYASSAPKTAPRTAVTADSTVEWMKADTICGWVNADRFPRVGRLMPSRNAPTTTMRVGTSRKVVVYAKKGSNPSRAPNGLRPLGALVLGCSANSLGPVGHKVGLGLVVLLRGQEDRRATGLGQCVMSGLVDRARRSHGRFAHRSCAALEPQVLALVGVEVLLPQPGCRRVSGILVDRLHVVAADDGAGRDDGLPVHRALELDALCDVQVVPVDDDGRLTRLDRGRVWVNRQEVAGGLERREEGDSLADVVGGSSLAQARHDNTDECRAGLCRVAVEGHLALVRRLQQIRDLRRSGDLARVIADAHVTAVVVDPQAVRVLERGGDVSERRHLVRREHAGVG